MRMNLDHVASGRFVLGRDVHCEFDYWPLAVSMPPTKVCPLCKIAVVHVRRKTCERCDHVFWSKQKLWEQWNQLGKVKISCTRPVNNVRKLCSHRQEQTIYVWQAKSKIYRILKRHESLKPLSKLCIGRNKTVHYFMLQYISRIDE